MSKQFSIAGLKESSRAIALWTQAAVLAFAAVLPAVLSGTASAAQLTQRSVTLSSSQSEATGVEYSFGFTLPTTTPVQGILLEFCDTPLGTCNLPSEMDISGATYEGQTFSEAAAFSIDSAAGTEVALTRTATDPETLDPKILTIGGITNPELIGNFTTVYVRISLFDTETTVGTPVHAGTVAGAINAQLVVTGRVQERLEFCVAALARNATMPEDCDDAPSFTDIDIGVIDNTTVAIAPVATTSTNGSNDSYGMAMLNTNASSGAFITFIPVPGSGTNHLSSFRVPGAVCDVLATSTTDQCFTSADDSSPAGTTMTIGQENFGMAVACFDSPGAPFSTTSNLGFSTTELAYDGDGDDDCSSYTNDDFSSISKFAWNSDSTPKTIAESNSVVHNEVVKLTFAAAAAATTPTGSYSVTSMYIATPHF